MADTFLIPSRNGVFEITEKRSKFIGLAARIDGEDDAKTLIEQTRAAHRDARHNAWAYVPGSAAGRSSDDGEPSGTAGPPMLEILTKGGFRSALVVVARYFGGIHLGRGGLIRVYSECAKGAVDNSLPREYAVMRRISISSSYDMSEQIKYEITRFNGIVLPCEYAGDVTVNAVFSPPALAGFTKSLNELSSGKASLLDLGDMVADLEKLGQNERR